jgi:hypothetical protein
VKVCAKKRNSSEYGSPNYEGEEVQDDVCWAPSWKKEVYMEE